MSREKRYVKRLSILCLLILVILLIAFTALVTIGGLYAVKVTPLKVEWHPKFSVSELTRAIVEIFMPMTCLIIGGILGLIFAAIFFRIRGQEEARLDTSASIAHTLWKIIKVNCWEVPLIFLIGVLVLLNLAIWMENIQEITPTSLAPTVVMLLLTLISAGLTLIAAHYAFLAEQKADHTAKNSEALLMQKGDFIPHFSGFVKRINRIIIGEDGIKKRLAGQEAHEYHFFHIRCFFLTPFLSHAGMTTDNRDLYRDFGLLQGNMLELMENPYCHVQILTLTPRSLIAWYSRILWIEKMKGAKKSFSMMNKQERQEQVESIMSDLWNNKFGGSLQMKFPAEPVKSFNQLYEEYFVHIARQWKQHEGRSELRFTANLPFQFFLVSERIISKPKHFPKLSSYAKVSRTEYKEQHLCMVMSYVGYDTYTEFVRRLRNEKDHARGNGGIDLLLRKLHSAFYSEDQAMCQIVVNHFTYYWDTAQTADSPPYITKEKLNRFDINAIILER